MNAQQINIGDLVWVPDKTYAYDKPSHGYKYNIQGPLYGLVLSTNQASDNLMIKLSVATDEKKYPRDIYKSTNDKYNLKENKEYWFKVSDVFKIDNGEKTWLN